MCFQGDDTCSTLKKFAPESGKETETVAEPSPFSITSGTSNTEFVSSIAGVAAALTRNDETFCFSHAGSSETMVKCGPASESDSEAMLKRDPEPESGSVDAVSDVTVAPAQKPVSVKRTVQVEPPAVKV